MLSLDPSHPSLEVGQSVQITAYEDGIPVPPGDLSWTNQTPALFDLTPGNPATITGTAPGTGILEALNVHTRRGGGSFPNIRV